MALIEWSDSYALGNEKIDSQHQQLVVYLNELNDAMLSGQGQDNLSNILLQLANYTSYHFKTEEDCFDNIDYPDAAGHRRAHKLFIDQINDFQMSLDGGQILLSMKVRKFLKDWLLAHINGIDRDFVSCLQRKAA
jgi:hemerythrin